MIIILTGLRSHCSFDLHVSNQQCPPDWKRSVFFLISKNGNAKECSYYHTIALISHANKVIFKILQARLQQYVNLELPDVQAGFRKGRGTRYQIANIRWKRKKKQENSRETSTSASLTMLKPLTGGSQQTGKFFFFSFFNTNLFILTGG